MNIKDKIAEIVGDKSLSYDEMIAKINDLISGKAGTFGSAGATSGGTGEGAGGGKEGSSSSGNNSDKSGNSDGESSGGKDGEKSSANQSADSAQSAADSAQSAADSAQSAANDASANGDPSASQKQAAANKAQEAANKAQSAADAAADAAANGDEQTAGQKANEARQYANEAQRHAQSAGAGNKSSNDEKGQGGSGSDDSGEGSDGSSDSGENSGNQGSRGQSQSGKSGQNQGQNQGQNSQSQQNQKQDPEEWLKDLDLGKKQRYQKSKGDGSDDPAVDGLPPGEIEGDDEPDSQLGGQEPEIFDEYKAGYYIGKAYAKEMFKGYGARPIYSKYYDLPDLEPMKIIESMIVESSQDDEIRNILSGSGNAASKAEDIYKLLFPDYKEGANNDVNNVTIVPEASIDDWRDDNHVISKEEGKAIKDKLNAEPNKLNTENELKDSDPDWGTTYTDGETQERMKYISHILDPNKIPDKFHQEVARKYAAKFGARIEKNSEGIIDWKKVLQDFMNEFTHVRTMGPVRQGVYSFSGIGARHRKTIYEQTMKKVVIYADTSGSAYNFCSTAVSEVAKMAKDCNVEMFDINLFTDVVYSVNKDISREKISSDEFGFENVNSGGTSLDNVYNHIIENYIDGYDLVDDVACIIIMTDVDGITDSGSSDVINNPYLKDIVDRLVYLLFDPSNTPRRSLNKYLPKRSNLLLITPEMMNENVVYKNSNSVLEAIGRKSIDDVEKRIRNTEFDSDSEKFNEFRRKANIQSMRRLDRLDELVPNIFSEMERIMPNLKYVKEVNYFEDGENTYYIDDDLRVWIHKDFVSFDDASKLLKFCEKTNVYKILGNVMIKGIYGLRNFPKGFPKVIDGKFILNNVPNLESFDNVPVRMEDYYINIHDSRRHRDELVNQAKELGLTVEVDNISTSTLTSKFKNKNESMKVNEAIGRRSVDDVKKQISKAEQGGEVSDEFRRKANIQSMRRLDRLDELVPDIFAAMNEILPEVKITKEVNYFEDTENTFYIDDDLRLWIHKDFRDRRDVVNLIELCKRVSVFMIVGEVIIQEMPELTSFPAGFPKEIKGFFKLRNTFNLRNLDNAPKIIYGNEDPYIAPRSRFFSTDVANKYKESITDKQNRHVNVMDVLRQRNNTYESMNNITKGAEIAKRFAIGQRYLNEEFPGSMNKIFKTKFPQEPKYSDMLDEPDREDFPEGEEGERKFIGAQKRYDAIKAKREKRQRRYEEELEEYNRLQPLVRKNKEIFHDVISPIMEINWDDIEDSDIKVIRDYPGVLKDLKDNKKSFKGLKLFTDAKGLISLVYAKTRNDDECRIVFFRNEDGEIIQGIDNIEKAIRERKKIYNMVDDYLTKELNYTYNDFPEGKNNVEPVEDVFLKFLYWSLAKMNGSVLNYKGKAFKLDNVIYNPNGLTNDEFIDYCVSSITNGKMQRKLKDNTKFEFKRGYGKGTIDLRAVADSRGQGGTGAPNSISFAKLVMRINSDNPSFNPAVYFSDTAIRAILLGLVIRAEDGSRRFTAEDIIYANRDELLQMAYDSMDVNIFNSSLKYMSYKEKDVDVSQNGSIVNTQGVLLLFPDLCKAEYVVKTDINQAILNNYIKTAYRRYSRAGMLSTIKNYDYDPKTGERVRRDIVGDFKKVDLNLTTLDNFKRYSKYFKEADFNDANDVIKDAYNIKYGDDTDAHGVKIANKKYKNYIENINSIKGYPDIIISEIVNNPDLENDSNLNMLIDLYGEIEDILADVLRYDPNSDYGDSVDDKVNEIKRKVNTIESSYSMMSDVRDPKKLNAIRGIISRSERQSAKRREAARKRREEMMNQPKFEYDVAPFNTIVDTAANDYASVKRILNTIDFAKADEDAIDEFGSKDELIRRVTKNVDAALGFARVLASSADGEKIASLESAYKELGEILDSIVGFNNDMEESDEAVTKTAMELEDVARKLAREAKKYSGTSSRQAGFTA